MSSLHRGQFVVLFLLFRDRVPLGNSSVCRETHFIDQTVFSCLCLLSAEIKDVHHHRLATLKFLTINSPASILGPHKPTFKNCQENILKLLGCSASLFRPLPSNAKVKSKPLAGLERGTFYSLTSRLVSCHTGFTFQSC